MNRVAKDGDELWEVMACKVMSELDASLEEADKFWLDAGCEREDVFQEARMRAWSHQESHDGSAPLRLHVYCGAWYGVLECLRRMSAQRGGRPMLERFIAGLEDELHEREKKVRSVSFSDLGYEEESWVRRKPWHPQERARLEREDASRAIHSAARSCLKGRERRIVFARYGIDTEELSVAEIAEREGLTRQRVNQIIVRAMDKLRGELRADEIMGL